MANRHQPKVFAMVLGVFVHGALTRRRCIVAVSSQREANQIFACSQGSFRLHASETVDELERYLALSHPGQLFAAVGSGLSGCWVPVTLADGRRVVTGEIAETLDASS